MYSLNVKVFLNGRLLALMFSDGIHMRPPGIAKAGPDDIHWLDNPVLVRPILYVQ